MLKKLRCRLFNEAPINLWADSHGTSYHTRKNGVDVHCINRVPQWIFRLKEYHAQKETEQEVQSKSSQTSISKTLT